MLINLNYIYLYTFETLRHKVRAVWTEVTVTSLFFALFFFCFVFFALSLATRQQDVKCYWTVIIKLTKKNSYPPLRCPIFTSQFWKYDGKWHFPSKFHREQKIYFIPPLPPTSLPPHPNMWFVQLIKRDNLLVFSVASYQHSLISILLKFYKDINIEGYNTVKNTK